MNTKKAVTSIFTMIFILLFVTGFLFAAAVQMDRQEVIQRSKFIFTGEVLTKHAHWNTKGNMIVTDYTFRIDEVLFGDNKIKTLKLTFAGGSLPEEGQAVSDVPEFNVGDIVLLMVEDIEKSLLSPVTGMYQGKYVAAKDQSDEATKALGKVKTLDGKNSIVTDSRGEIISFQDFIKQIKEEIKEAKKAPCSQ